MSNWGDSRLPLSFWSKCTPEPNSGCWFWTAARDKDGYGKLKFDDAFQQAHRVSYRAFVGELLSNLVIDHLCRTRECVNPRHLEQVTQKVNVHRGSTPVAACPVGHVYSEVGTYNYIDRHGHVHRNCRACVLQKKRRAS